LTGLYINVFPAPLCRLPAQNQALGPSNETLRECVQENQNRCSKQNQGRSYGHQQNVLEHMDREQMMIKGDERGAESDPQ